MKTKNTLLLIIVFKILVGCNSIFDESTDHYNFKDFEAAWQSVDSVYPYFEWKQLNWDSLHHVYTSRAQMAEGDEIVGILLEMLGELKDGHIYLETKGGKRLKPYIPPRTLRDNDSFSPVIIRKYFPEDLNITGQFGISYGMTQDDIGYIYISSFGSHIDFVNDFSRVMDHIRNSKALIIDVRHNTGGDGINVNSVVSRFISEPAKGLDSYLFDELLPGASIEPSGNFQYTKPIVLLCNGVCFSATESFVEIMKHIPNVTVVGDTTGGGSAGFYGYEPPASGNFYLPGGMLVHVGTLDIRKYDNRPFENIGIAPDIQISQSGNDIKQGKDGQFEFALDLIDNH